MRIRRYEVGEESGIWDVYFRATHESNGRDYPVELLNRWAPPDMDMAEWAARLREKNPFVAVVGEEVVGFAEVDAAGCIEYFYVAPDRQGQGVGKALLATLTAEALAAGAPALTADVSVTAKGFFLARGFEVVESRMNHILGYEVANFAMIRDLSGLGVEG